MQGNKLVADVTRERVSRFPGFDRDEFQKLDENALNRMDEQIVTACCPDETVDRLTSAERYNRWAHYRSPSWWDASYYNPNRADRAARDIAGSGPAMPARDDVRATRDRDNTRKHGRSL